MDHKFKSVLRFEKYIVKEIYYQANESYEAHTDGVSLDFDFDAQSDFSKDNKKMEVELRTNIFERAEANNYPFEMSVCIKGTFYLEIGDEKLQNFEANAIAILFPYIRAIVSTYTANANIVPVILPPMNINAYLKKKNRKGE